MNNRLHCPCGHDFEDSLGAYGCPSCEGDAGPAVSEHPSVALERRLQDQTEAAELQNWLVGNARTLRPADGGGLMAWALAVLQERSARPSPNNPHMGAGL